MGLLFSVNGDGACVNPVETGVNPKKDSYAKDVVDGGDSLEIRSESGIEGDCSDEVECNEESEKEMNDIRDE